MFHGDFVEELHSPLNIPLADKVDAPGRLVVNASFPDPEGVLETAYDFARRLKCGDLLLETKLCETSVFEEYIIRTEPGKCIISAADTEGIRRGIYRLADILRNATADALPVMEETVTPQIRIRMNRYRFGSEKYPLKGHDDLLQETDLMPDGYLERFAYEGINYDILSMQSLFVTDIVPVFCSHDSPEKQALMAKRREKLRMYVKKAARYGIKIIFYINTPQPLKEDDPIVEQYPAIKGPALSGFYRICPESEEGYRFLYEGMLHLYQEIPGLGGTMQIIHGEAATPCISMLNFGEEALCRSRCGKSNGEIMARIADALYRGTRDAGSNGELILWNYDPLRHGPEFRDAWLPGMLEHAPDGMIFQANAESGYGTMQLGKSRNCGDYWLAESNLSECFTRTAEAAAKYGKEISAKIQVGTSHEIGCIPYLEVPGLLYRKYANLQKYHVSSVFQCWGAGGTPGFMNAAARELSFTDTTKVTEEEFLTRMGKIYWGEKFAAQIGEVWKLFSDAFAGYPRSNMIQYFGPIADGVTWPLYFKPWFTPLYDSWVVFDELSGDNICECLDVFTLDEAAILLDEMSRKWEIGLAKMRRIVNEAAPLNMEQDRSRILGEALGIHFCIASRITRFYQMRRDLYQKPSLEILYAMRALADEIMTAQKAMITLQKEWPHLGYNPEARGHKYTEEKILRAIAVTEQELAEEFPRMEQAIRAGSLTLEFPCKVTYKIGSGTVKLPDFEWNANWDGDTLKIQVHCYDMRSEVSMDELFIGMDDSGKSFPFLAHVLACGKVYRIDGNGIGSFSYPGNDWVFELALPLDTLPGKSKEGLRLNISRLTGEDDHRCTWPGILQKPQRGRLDLVYYNPTDMGLLM